MKVSLLAVFAVAAGSLWGATCKFTDGAWDTTPSSAEDDIVIASGDLTWGAALPPKVKSWTQTRGTVTFQTVFPGQGDFQLFEVTGDVSLTGGTWTHASNSTTEKYRLNVACGGNFTVGEEAEINVDAKGYNNAGPGRSNNHSGGCYGGYCDNFVSVTVYGRCYGSIASPVNLGSSGCAASRWGGGAVKLTVAGTLTVNGHIYARGSQKVESYYSGAGGSVWLTAAALVGAETGRIAADAGLNDNNYFGAGGRVSLCQTGSATDFSDYLGTATADGARKSAGGACVGSSGTVYYELASDGRGKGALVVDAHNATYKRSDFFIAEQDEGFSPKSITLKNGATLNVFGDDMSGSQTFVFGGKLVMDGTATLGVGKGATVDLRGMTTEMLGTGTRTLSLAKDVKVISDKTMALDGLKVKVTGTGLDWTLDTLVCTNGGGLAVSAVNTLDVGHLRVAKGGTVTTDAAFTLTGDVTVEDGGTVTHTANTKDSSYLLDWTVGGDMTVASGAKVTAKAKGYPQGVGLGSGGGNYKGSSHGGWAWDSLSGKAGNQVSYGSLTQPMEVGSGNAAYNGPGGGIVRLNIAGALVNDGRIDADGADGSTWFNSSGGSVWITAATISGSGKIESNAYGYNGTTSASHGLSGGGRVAVWLTQAGADFADYTGAFTAFGARNGSRAGGAGTVYLKTGDEAADGGTLIVSNATTYASEPTAISEKVTELAVGNLIVAKGSTLKFLDGKILSVSGDVVNRGTVTAAADSGIVLVGSGESTIDGDLTLGVFDCLVPGKTVSFVPDSTLTIVAGGRFKAEGSQSQPVTLKSTVDESAWNLAVDPTAAASVNACAVSDCDASGGQEIAAVNSTLTRTTNWSNSTVIYGQLLTWTGASGGSGWLTAANWDAGRAPLASDRILIPATEVQPVLGADAASIDLTVEAGATLDLAGFNYTVSENLAVTGTVKSAGTPTVSVGGNCDLTGATFNADGLTLLVAGAGEAVQTLKGGDATVNRVVLRPGAAGLKVTQGFAAFYLSAEAEAARQIEFAAGATVGARFSADFAASDSQLTLVSSAAGTPWNLVLGGTATATGVTVSDSSVSGTILSATDSTDGGRNVNWVFGTPELFHWTDTATSPAATDAAYVDSTLKAATGELTVRSLVLKSGAAFTLPKATTLTVTESMVVEDGATATLNGKLIVGGSFQILAGGTVTHSLSENMTTVYTMNVTVGGDFLLAESGKINLTGKGYAAKVGPGSGDRGGNHAGRAESHNSTLDNKTNGSALWPVKPGSGGANTAGGGAVQLVVAGVARIDGEIAANGVNAGDFYTGAGGSVAIRTSALVGGGLITANGGNVGNDYTGSGGRIAVILTDDGEAIDRFVGAMEAYSGKISSAAVPYPRGSAGTIYLELASDGVGRGVIIVDNSPTGAARHTTDPKQGVPRTDYPVMNDKSVERNESKNATWVLRNTVGLNITADAKIGNLVVEGAKPKIYLNGHTLKINSVRPADWPKDGTLPSFVVPGVDADGNPGKIIWKQGLMLIVK